MDNQKQINQMIAFIRAESHEKVQEIEQKAAAEYERRFQELKRIKSEMITSEYKLKRANAHVQRLIDSSHKKQEANASLIILRATLVDSIKQQVIKRLSSIETNPKYGDFLTNLIVQGLLSIQEERIQVRCRKVDEKIVQDILGTARDLFIKAVADSTGFTPTLEPLTIDTNNYLPNGYTEGAVEYCLGGVEVVARNGKIVCRNTLDARLELAFKAMLPHIRAFCYGEKPKKVQDGKLPHHLTTF